MKVRRKSKCEVRKGREKKTREDEARGKIRQVEASRLPKVLLGFCARREAALARERRGEGCVREKKG